MGEEAAAAVHRVVEGQLSLYRYRVSVTESSASTVSLDSREGFHDFVLDVVVVYPFDGCTVCLPRANFRIRGRMGPPVRYALDDLLTGHVLRPIRNSMIALLSEVYSEDTMVDAHVLVETFYRPYNEDEEDEGLTEHDDQSEDNEFEDEGEPMVFTGEDNECEDEDDGEPMVFTDEDDEPMIDGDQEEYESMVDYEYVWRPNPASRDAVDALESYIIKVDDDDDEATTTRCSVCLDELCSGSELTKMPCSHAFHRQCILTWPQNQPMCPLCHFALP